MDEIEQRIRAARPLSGNRDLPLSDRAKRELAELVMSAPAASDAAEARTERPWFRLNRPALVSIAAAAAVVVLVVVWSQAPTPVQAATPPLLSFTPVGGEPSELLLGMSENTCDDPWETAEPNGDVVIVTHDWNIATSIGANGEVEWSRVEPEVLTRVMYPDGSIAYSAVAGEPFVAPDQSLAGMPTPGTPLWENSFDPEEAGYWFADEFPETVDDVAGFFRLYSGFDDREGAANTFQDVNNLLVERVLDCGEQTTLLRYLATLPDIEVEGMTVDRIGRDALALSAINLEGGFEEYLFFEPTSGRILATERVYVGTERTDIGPPYVTSYTAWQLDN